MMSHSPLASGSEGRLLNYSELLETLWHICVGAQISAGTDQRTNPIQVHAMPCADHAPKYRKAYSSKTTGSVTPCSHTVHARFPTTARSSRGVVENPGFPKPPHHPFSCAVLLSQRHWTSEATGRSTTDCARELRYPQSSCSKPASHICHHPIFVCMCHFVYTLRSLAAYSSISFSVGKLISSSFCAYGVGTSAPVTRTGGAFR